MADKKKVVFYYSSSSFFSQIALLTLYEKDVEFDKVMVDLNAFEQNKPWYIRINPKGLVPALKHGDDIITESHVILDYLDAEFNTGIKLVPSPECQIGREVAQFRREFMEIKVDKLTYGILQNPELSITGWKLPWIVKYLGINMSKEAMRKKVSLGLDKMKKKALAEKNPEVRDKMMAKANARTHPALIDITKEDMQTIFADVNGLMDKIEKQLERTRLEQGVPDAWLVSARFTAADINLTVLLDRLTFIGVDEHFFSAHKRPLVYNYYNRLSKRKSVQKLRNQFLDFVRYLMWKKLKVIGPFVLAGACAAVAFKTKPMWEKMFS